MAGFLTPEGKARVLRALVGKGVAAGNVYLGLARSLPEFEAPTLANIIETSEPGYVRVDIDWNDEVVSEEGAVYISNTAEVTSGTPTTDMIPAPYAFITDAASGNVLAEPVITTPLAAPGTGGTFPAGTYFWVVTAQNDRGETLASNEVSATLLANATQAISWGAVAGATSYNIYRGTTSGLYEHLAGTVTAPTTTFTDTYASVEPGQDPTVNTASVGGIYYVWELAEPVDAKALKPILVPAEALIIE